MSEGKKINYTPEYYEREAQRREIEKGDTPRALARKRALDYSARATLIGRATLMNTPADQEARRQEEAKHRHPTGNPNLYGPRNAGG